MATNKSQDVGRSRMRHIAIRTKRVNFKSHHMPLNSNASNSKSSKHNFISPAACPKQISRRTVSFIPSLYGAWLQEEVISYLTWIAISEKVRQLPCVESLWLHSRAKPSAISFLRTFTCYDTH
ncbi:hypothetical protein TNCV_2500211 [Trichonephila clavipes]|nr:hypothetical protein TNCV_2500211 [Trichonephila clavipes]